MSNNEILAMYWEDDIPQVVIIYPNKWKHSPGGNWFPVELPEDWAQPTSGVALGLIYGQQPLRTGK